jgi:Mg2+ and Co2+ transporter CorA
MFLLNSTSSTVTVLAIILIAPPFIAAIFLLNMDL